MDNILKQNIERLGKKFITFRKGLVKCRDYIFKFLENPMIPLTITEANGEYAS